MSKKTKRKEKLKAKKVKKTATNVVALKVAAEKSTQRISPEILAQAKRKRSGLAVVAIDPFKPVKPMPGVVPDKALGANGFPMAMDGQVIQVSAWGVGNVMNNAFANGAAFVGYPMLAQLSQIAEYRKIVDCIATHMTRKFIKLQSTAKEDDKSERISQLNDALDAFKIRDLCRKAVEVNENFGRSHIYIDLGDGATRENLILPIGNGRNKMSQEKAVGLQGVKGFKVVEPMWTYPANYNANDPLTIDWYNPQTWFVQGKEMDRSRLLTLVGREVPDMLKPAYSFGGLSMVQMAMPYVDNWLRTRQSVADLIWSFSVSILTTDLNSFLAPGARTGLFERLDLFNDLRNNRGTAVLNKETEEYDQVNTPLGTLDMLQSQAQEQMASVCSIPLVFLLGISPHGLNASSEGEIRAFYDFINAYQMKLLHDPLTRIIDFIQLKLWGEVDDDITFSFEPLWALTEKEIAEVQKIRMETDDLAINAGTIDPREARQRIAADPNSEYPDIDVNDVPEPPVDELGGKSLDPGQPIKRPGEVAGGGAQVDEAKVAA